MKIRLFLALSVAVTPLSLVAQETEEDSPWAGNAKLGYLATSGNTENSTLNTGFEVGYTSGKWLHSLTAAAISASESEESTAEAYDVGWKSERKITDLDFVFGRVQWRKDKFGAYDTAFSQTLGYGRRLIDNDQHKLNVELGFGARQSELQSGENENETIFTAGGYYKWQFSETAQFRQDLKTEAGSSNTYIESVTAISARLIGDFALVASYTIMNNSNVPPLTEKTDTYTALALEYSF
jgi:putative salt-induced outer membrane protein